MKSLGLQLGVALLMAGCAGLAPKYQRPPAPVPATWPAAAAWHGPTAEVGLKPVAEMDWREFIVDERLRQLIDLALENNRDLRIATLNIARAQALYRIRRADLLPEIDATGSASYQRLPEDFSGTGEARRVDQYSVGLGVSAYELDLFGRVRSLKDQALEQYLATEQAQRTVRISLISLVATSFQTLAADRERLQLAQETLVSQQTSFDLTRNRFEAGVANALALSQARTSVEAAKVDVARFAALVAQDENALSLVVGAPVPADMAPLLLSGELFAMNDLPPGLPSEVLLQRPDILQAESLLKGFNANIGAARAAFFPRITLVSSLGYGSNELSDLFSEGSYAWSFVPRLTLPIFDAGGNAANLKVAKVDRDIAVAQYEKAIQTAFQEVADALAQRTTIGDQLTAQQALVEANAESLRLSTARFVQGVDSYLSVLDSQRSLYGAQQNLITIRLARVANLVTLFKALGGGCSDG